MRSFERSGEPRLSYWVDAPSGPVAGRVLLIHGYADHASRFDHVVDLWRERGLSVLRLDLRGHGHSDGARGHVAKFEDYVRDVIALERHANAAGEWTGTSKPTLFGHSMGGLIATATALELGDAISGVALTSPFFAVAKPPPALVVAVGKLVARAVPTLRQPSGLNPNDMTHDAARVRAYATDPLGFQHVTVGWFSEISRAQERVLERAPELRSPFYCIAGGADAVVSVPATRAFFEKLGSADKELEVAPGLFHEVLNEPEYRDLAMKLADRVLRWQTS